MASKKAASRKDLQKVMNHVVNMLEVLRFSGNNTGNESIIDAAVEEWEDFVHENGEVILDCYYQATDPGHI